MTASSGTALITGGSAGLGRALCEKLRGNGWRVVNCDLSRPSNATGDWMEVDLSHRPALDRAITEIVGRSPYNLVVHNAGASATGRFEALPVPVLLRILRLNAEAPMVLTSALEDGGAFAPGAGLVFISSLSHFTGYPGAAAYAASKDAIAAYARGVARRLRRRGVRVLTVFPGPIATGHAERHAPPGADGAQRMAPERLATMILAAVARHRSTLVPGWQAKFTALAGRFAPRLTARYMRRLIYERLEREVW